MSRRHDLATYHTAYDEDRPARFVCRYCGDRADTIDHVPPLSYVSTVGIQRAREVVGWLRLVDSCGACNGYLGSMHLLTLSDRLAHLKKVYSTKRSKLRVAPGWTERQIKALGPNLRRQFRASVAEHTRLTAKLDFLDLMLVAQAADDSL